MRSLSVETGSQETAQGLSAALAGFHPEVSGSEDTGYRVTVALTSFDRHVVAVLDAIEEYVSERDHGPARVELDGHKYTLHAAEAAAGA